MDDEDEIGMHREREELKRALYAKQKAQKEDAPLADDDLKEIEERAAQATQGPWITEVLDGYVTGHVISKHHTYTGGAKGLRPDSVTHPLTMINSDAYFIAYSRTDIPRLLREIKRLRTQLRKD